MWRLLLFILIMMDASFAMAQNLPCKEVIGYYPNWQWYDRSKLVKPSSIDYSKYTIINYAFFKPELNGNISSTDTWADDNLLNGQPNWSQGGYYPNTSIVSLAHNSGVKILPSIGGWTLSDNFPVIAADPVKRQNFANACTQLIIQYGFDGIDLDWEYPGYSAHGGSAVDKNNFTLLLQAVRNSLNNLGTQNGKSYLLTACFGASQSHMLNIDWPNIVNLLDCINLMSYDFFGAWDNVTNHNAPLYAPAQGDPAFNISSAVNLLLTNFNVAPQKICAGLPFYGRSFKTPSIPLLHGPASGSGDTVTFSDDDGTPLYYNVLKKINLFDKHFDNLAQSPYLIGKNGLNTFLSYDDSSSITTKAAFIKSKNLRGCIIWEITGDYVETTAGSGVIAGTPLATAVKNVFCNTGGGANVCSTPLQVAAVPSTTSASINWVANGAVSYEIQYKLNSATSWAMLNSSTNTVILHNLTAGQTYQVQVRAVCSNMLSSLFSNAVSFTTLSPVNQIPVVAITQPVNNQTFTAGTNINISAAASDPDGTISKVEFYQGTQLLAVDNMYPYSFDWNTAVTGDYQIWAKAFDNVNASASSSIIKITVNPPAPECIIANPSNNDKITMPADVTIDVKVNALGVAVSNVNIFANGILLKSLDKAPYHFVWSKPLAGTYSITATANTILKTSIQSVPVTIYILPPVVNSPPSSLISQPAQNSVFIAPAQIAIVAVAADLNGFVTKVDFFAGATLIGTDYSAPFSTVWNASFAGTYNIVAVATDNQGASTSSNPVQIIVKKNSLPLCSLQQPVQNQMFTAPANIAMNALASDTDGYVSKVDFYNGNQLLGTDNSAPFTYNWQNVGAGTYAILAKATDDKGGVGIASTVTITVQSTLPACNQYQNYVEGNPYSINSVVSNNGGIYKCNVPGWCSGAGWAYAPGAGTAWQDAWTMTGTCTVILPDCSTVNPYIANAVYQSGSKVKNNAQIYACNIPSWCSGSASFYAPGVGSEWQQAWTLLGPCPNGSSRVIFGSNSNDLLLYPNPAKELITLNILNAPQGLLIMRIVDINSRIVFEKSTRVDATDFAEEIDLGNLSAGIYQVQVESSSWVKSILMKKWD